jgi:putative cell wall-binding protein
LRNSPQHPVRRAAVGVLAGTLAFTGGALAVGLSPANALPGFEFDRLAGDDRFATAAAIATDRFGTNASDVILANGINFPDALAGNYLAGAEGAPILLTLPNNLVTPTKDALAALNTANVRIVGGTAAISQAVEDELESLGYTVSRVAGTDRYKTAAAIAADPGNANVGSIGADRTAIVANGEGFADALTAGPLSVDQSFPILLTQPATLRPEANGALDSLEIDNVLIVGGTAAVSPVVEAAIVAKGITVTRLAGANRSATAVAIANFAITNLGFSDSHVLLARGDNGPTNNGFADALSGGPHAGSEAAPIVLALTPTSNAPETLAFLTANDDTLVDGHIFGGTAAISAATEQEAEVAAQGDAPATLDPFNTLTVTPAAAATLQLADEALTTSASDDRGYTATGLANGTTYRITLVNAESITTDAAGNKTFLSSADANSPSGFSVDIGTDIADITSINNTTVAGVNTITTTPVNGSITFTVDGAAPGTVVPAVYLDGGPGGTPTTGGTSVRLETAATAAGQIARATETFGLGGPTTYTAP